MSAIIRPNVANIISLWFSVDTPLRRNKITLNADLWKACQTISGHFRPPSQVKQTELYRPGDKAAFAKAVQQELAHNQRRGQDQSTAVFIDGRESTPVTDKHNSIMKLTCLLIWGGVFLLQFSAHGQAVVEVISDSTWAVKAPVVHYQYDFYYSDQQASSFEKSNDAIHSIAGRKTKNRFRDKTYTEVVLKGAETTGGFEDYKLIGSGRLEEIRPNGEWK